MDDFGDLYAGLDENLSAGMVKESACEMDGANGKAVLVLEAEGGAAVVENNNSSDSEDDLHIVLNDEDCPNFRSSERVAIGDEGVAAEWNDEDDEADLVLVAATDRPSKDQKCAEQLAQQPDRLPQGGAERGGVAKGGYRNWHVGTSLGFPSNGRASMSGRADWDHHMVSYPGATATSNSGIPTVAGFFLPKNRTIFDIDIEEFEQKPWKYHGVDTTDYFNFGLDVESWKSYCKEMNRFTQQARIFRPPSYESSRPNHAFESTMVSNKAMLSEVSRDGWGERSSIHEKVDKGRSGFEMPRGRAIQVEGGFAERLPSTDMKRPRLWDSDVVIRVAMEDSVGNVSLSCEEARGRIEQRQDHSILKSKNGLSRSLSLDHDGQRVGKIANHAEPHCPENNGAIVKVKDKHNCEKRDSPDPSRVAAQLFDESLSCEQVLRSSSLSDLESHSRASSRNELSLPEDPSPDSTSLSPVSGLQESNKSDVYISNDSARDGIRVEQEKCEDHTHACSLSTRRKKCRSRTRLQSRFKLGVHADNEKASVLVDKKCRNALDTTGISYGTRTRRYDHCVETGVHFSSYEESEMSRSHKIRRDDEHISEASYLRNFYKKGNHGTSLSRNQEERETLLKQRGFRRDNRTKQREHNIHRSHHDDATIKDCNRPVSKYNTLLHDKNSCLWQKRGRENEQWHRGAGYENIVTEDRYQEESVQEIHRRDITYYDSEEIFEHEFGRRVSHSARELRNQDRKSKYDITSCFDLLNRSRRYFGNDMKTRRHPDHRLLDSKTYRESSMAEERSWLDDNLPAKYLPISRRSSERHADHWKLPNNKEMQSQKTKDRCYFVPGSKAHRHSLHEDPLELGIYDHLTEERELYVDNIMTIQKREFNCIANQRIPAEEIKYRHHQWDRLSPSQDSSLRDRSSRHEKGCVSKQSDMGQKFLDDHLLRKGRKKKPSERCSVSNSKDRISAVAHIFHKGQHEQAAIERREPVNVHANGWKGKIFKRSNEEINGTAANHTMNKKLKNAGGLESEGTRTHPSSSQVERGGKDCGNRNFIPQEDDEIEEGQLIEEPDNRDAIPTPMRWSSAKNTTHLSAIEAGVPANLEDEKNKLSEDPAGGNKMVTGYDRRRILETIARMEKRRERFKDPITLKPASEAHMGSEIGVVAALEVARQERPARKRRWGGG